MARLVLHSLLPTPGPFHFHTCTIHSKRFAPLCDHHFLRWCLISGHCPIFSDLRDFTNKIYIKAKFLTELFEVISYLLWSILSRIVHLKMPKKLGKSLPVSRWSFCLQDLTNVPWKASSYSRGDRYFPCFSPAYSHSSHSATFWRNIKHSRGSSYDR